jgi:hypothetical protein
VVVSILHHTCFLFHLVRQTRAGMIPSDAGEVR